MNRRRKRSKKRPRHSFVTPVGIAFISRDLRPWLSHTVALRLRNQLPYAPHFRSSVATNNAATNRQRLRDLDFGPVGAFAVRAAASVFEDGFDVAVEIVPRQPGPKANQNLFV